MPDPSPKRAATQPSRAALVLGLAACSGAASVGSPSARPAPRLREELAVAAEGPCARLSVQAVGARRFLVYGDTGYDLHAWLPNEAVAAAQSIVELRPGGAARDPRLLAGLPTDGRGYVPGELSLGGEEGAAWLERVTTRYQAGGKGALFEREADGFRLGAHGWERAGGVVVSRPAAASGLPALPADACAGARASEGPPRDLRFVPLAAIATPSGGVVVAGRCADDGPRNLVEPVVRVLHGRAGGRAWSVASAPLAPELDGIVNASLAARSDDDVALTLWEPFDPPRHRRPYLARWDGRAWSRVAVAIEDGLMSAAWAPDGGLYLAAGRALYRRAPGGAIARVPLPPPRFAKGSADDVHVHDVRAWGEELWVESSYRVELGEKDQGPAWASVVHTNVALPRVVYCDAREPADRAVWEVE